jgi:hypothetical protein
MAFGGLSRQWTTEIVLGPARSRARYRSSLYLAHRPRQYQQVDAAKIEDIERAHRDDLKWSYCASG